MRGGDPEDVLQESRAGVSLPVALVEVFLGHRAVCVEDEHAGMRDALDAPPCLLVEDAELANQSAARIAEQGIGDAMPLGETRKHVRRVVADRIQGDPLGLQVRRHLLQLHELRLTERSPGGTAMEHDQRAPASPIRHQIDRLPRLIAELPRRECRSHRGPNPHLRLNVGHASASRILQQPQGCEG